MSFYNDADNEGNDNGDDDDDDCDYVLMKFFVEICRLDESFSGGTHIAMKHKSDKKVTHQVNENQCDNIFYNKINLQHTFGLLCCHGKLNSTLST